MPNLVTHNYFAKEVLSKTTNTIKNTFIEKQNIYELFAQGFDPFFFYELLPFRKKISNFCHTNYTDDFFLNFISDIKEENLQNNSSIIAALYGHLAHYVLDSTCHPYIIYKTGEYDRKKTETIKYNGKHTKMEMQIDAYFYEQKTNQKFSKFKIHKYLITKENFNKELLNTLNKTYNKTFNISKGGSKYQTGCRMMYYAYKFLIVDTTGIKKKIYKLYDKITPNKYGVYENYNSHITSIDNSIFNTEHKKWTNPWNEKIQSNESFFDLYNKAIDSCLELFEATYKFLNNKITETEYKKVLKDKAYTTGLSWKIKKEMKYLEF